jgi:DNA polymerase/3'-5' exonuclease PolX
MELEKARTIAEELKTRLEQGCERIEIAGSIRRQKPEVGDIELLVIPRYGGLLERVDCLNEAIVDLMVQEILGYRLNKLGSRVYGPKNKLMVHIPSGIGVDIFSTDEECWPVALVVRTGGKVTNQRIASAALRKGYRFHAYGRGFTTPTGQPLTAKAGELVPAQPPDEGGRDDRPVDSGPGKEP